MANLKNPLVSVIIPTYNRCQLVQETIDSVLLQTYSAYEVIIVDDGSTDGTQEALAARYGDRIIYLWQENQGESVALNRGIEAASGEYIATLDSDDLWAPQKLVRQVQLLELLPEAAMVCCQGRLIDFAGNQLDLPFIGEGLRPSDYSLEALLQRNTIGGGSKCLLRRLVLDEIGGYDPQIQYGEDWDLWLRLRTRGDFGFLAEPLAYIRRHRNTQSHVLPQVDIIAKILDDHLRLLTKAYDIALQLMPGLAALRNKSFARQYGEAAFASYARGSWTQATTWLVAAAQLDPDVWSDGSLLFQMLVNYGVALGESIGDFIPEQLETYVDGTLEHWPNEVHLPLRSRRKILGKLYAEAGYRHYLVGNEHKARHLMWLALRMDNELWHDRGLIKRLVLPHGRPNRASAQIWPSESVSD